MHSPVQHALKLGRVYHVSLEGRKEYLGCVTEDNDPQGDGEGQDVDAEGYLGPAPLIEPKKNGTNGHQFQKALSTNFGAWNT